MMYWIEIHTVPILRFVLYLILSSSTLLHWSFDASLIRALLIFVLSIGAYVSLLMIVMFPLYLFYNPPYQLTLTHLAINVTHLS